MKIKSIILLLTTALVLSGCTTIANIRDTSSIYKSGAIEGAPTILIADLSDNRVDKDIVGQIGMIESFKTNRPINVALTDRIAAGFKTKGFNVKKIGSIHGQSGDMSEAVKKNNGIIFISGSLTNFFIISFDPLLDTVKGRVTFYIKIFDDEGKLIFEKDYLLAAEHWAGISSVTAFLSDKPGAEATIEKCLQISSDKFCEDDDVKRILRKYNSNY